MKEVEPEFLPYVLIFTGIGMILIAYLGFFASRAESKTGLNTYALLCGFLMVNYVIFTALINFGAKQLEIVFEDKCYQIMPYFNKNFYDQFGCNYKYTQNSTDYTSLTCLKEEIASIWETSVGIAVTDQSDFYGCLNSKCCDAMVSFVKGKFDILSTFSIVAFFFILISINTA